VTMPVSFFLKKMGEIYKIITHFLILSPKFVTGLILFIFIPFLLNYRAR